MSPTTFRLELPANWGAHPVWHSEHLRAADKLHQATHYCLTHWKTSSDGSPRINLIQMDLMTDGLWGSLGKFPTFPGCPLSR